MHLMDEQTLAQYRVRLLDVQRELRAELDQSTEVDRVELDGSIGRISRMDALQSQQMALELKRRREERLVRIGTALDRIRQGTYGLCVRCKAPIDPARLDAFPEVLLCVACADRKAVR